MQNPNPSQIDFTGAYVKLDVLGKTFASGVSDAGGTVPAFGEAIVAVVEPAPGQRIDETEVIDHVKSRLAGYKAPKKTNAALVALANQYGLPEENVAVHKGTRARGVQAVPGFNPTATIVMTAGIADNQYNRVAGIYNPAMQRALDDETTELTNHMTEALLANGKVLEDNGFDIK